MFIFSYDFAGFVHIFVRNSVIVVRFFVGCCIKNFYIRINIFVALAKRNSYIYPTLRNLWVRFYEIQFCARVKCYAILGCWA